MPYDQFAAAPSIEREQPPVPPVNFYRAVQSREPAAIASAVAPHLDGNAPRSLAGGPARRYGGVLLAHRLQGGARVSGRRRSSS